MVLGFGDPELDLVIPSWNLCLLQCMTSKIILMKCWYFASYISSVLESSGKEEHKLKYLSTFTGSMGRWKLFRNDVKSWILMLCGKNGLLLVHLAILFWCISNKLAQCFKSWAKFKEIGIGILQGYFCFVIY